MTFSWNRVTNFKILATEWNISFFPPGTKWIISRLFFTRSIDKVQDMFPWPIVRFCVIFYAAKWRNLRIFPSQTIRKFRNISLVDWRISHFYPATDGLIQVFVPCLTKNFCTIYLRLSYEFSDIFLAADWRISGYFFRDRLRNFMIFSDDWLTYLATFFRDRWTYFAICFPRSKKGNLLAAISARRFIFRGREGGGCDLFCSATDYQRRISWFHPAANWRNFMVFLNVSDWKFPGIFSRRRVGEFRFFSFFCVRILISSPSATQISLW